MWVCKKCSFSFLLSSPDHKALSHKSRRGFKLMISFHKGLVTWGVLWRASQEGMLKLPTPLKSLHPGKSNESRAFLLKKHLSFPFNAEPAEATLSPGAAGPHRLTSERARQPASGVRPPTVCLPHRPFPKGTALTGLCLPCSPGQNCSFRRSACYSKHFK